MHNNTSRIDGNTTQPEQSDMVNAGHTQLQRAEDARLFMARYLELHELQARSVRSDLDRLRSLIDDASARLLTSFGAIQAITGSRNERRGQDVELDAGNEDRDVERAVGNAISALQFQDMATQLVGHAAQRIAVLEKITQSLGRLPDASVDELAAAVSDTLRGRHTGPVEQACMAGGSVELF
jgi:hypothetical protein